jgi:ubiquitin-like protein Pup
MSDGGQVHGGSEREQEEPEVDEAGAAAEEAREVVDDVDDLLDEIDDVLEENAEEFVRNYVQKGGQ